MSIERIILKILKEHPEEHIGFNELYREVCKIKQCPRETFDRKLKSLVQEGLVQKYTPIKEPSESEKKKLSEEELQKIKKIIRSIRAQGGVAYYSADEDTKRRRYKSVLDELFTSEFALELDEVTETAWNILNSKKWFNLNKELKISYYRYFKKLEEAPFLFLKYVYQAALTYKGQEASMSLLKRTFKLYINYFFKWQTELKKIREKLKEEFPKFFEEEEKPVVIYFLKYKQFNSEKKMQKLLYDLAKLNIKLKNLRKSN